MEAKVENGISSEKHFAFSKHNFHKICRLCFSNGKEVLYDLNLSTYEQETLQMVMDSFAIHSGSASSSFDCLPSNICINCIKHILQYRSFRDQLKQSNTMLKLVYDYLYNCAEPSNILDPNHKKKHRNKFITISYKEYPTIEDLLSRCRLVSNQIEQLGVIKTEEIQSIDEDDVEFNLKVLQPVSDDVPSVIFNESDNCGYNNNELCGELLENVPMNIFLQEQVHSDIGNRLSISVDNNDDESNLLERILQATNDQQQSKKSVRQSKVAVKRSANIKSNLKKSLGVNRNRKRVKGGSAGIAQNGLKHHQVIHHQVHPQHHQVILNHSQFQTQGILDRKDFIRLEEAEVIIKDEPDISYDIEYEETSDLSLFSLLNTAPKAPKYSHHNQNGIHAEHNHRPTSNKPRSNPKRWSCSKCDRLFVSYNAYTQHLETAHLHHFTCEICLKQFTCETTFQRHKRLHQQRVY